MSTILSRSKTSEVIDKLEEVLKLTLYDYLHPSQVKACRSHFADTKQIQDDFSIKVDFETVPTLRQTKVSFTLTPKAKANATH